MLEQDPLYPSSLYIWLLLFPRGVPRLLLLFIPKVVLEGPRMELDLLPRNLPTRSCCYWVRNGGDCLNNFDLSRGMSGISFRIKSYIFRMASSLRLTSTNFSLKSDIWSKTWLNSSFVTKVFLSCSDSGSLLAVFWRFRSFLSLSEYTYLCWVSIGSWFVWTTSDLWHYGYVSLLPKLPWCEKSLPEAAPPSYYTGGSSEEKFVSFRLFCGFIFIVSYWLKFASVSNGKLTGANGEIMYSCPSAFLINLL